MHNYFKEVWEISDQLEGMNFSILQELDVLMILNSLLIHYNIFVKTLTNKFFLPTLEELELQLSNEKMQIKLNVKKLQMMPWSFKVETKVQSSRLQLKFQGLHALKKQGQPKRPRRRSDQHWQAKLEKVQSNKPLTK